MRRAAVIAAVTLLVFMGLGHRGAISAQSGDGKPGAKPDSSGLLGFWTEIYTERNNDFFSSLADAWRAHDSQPRNPMGLYAPMLWKFTKTHIEVGPNRKDRFPTWRYRYELGFDGKPEAIDLKLLSEEDKIQASYRGIWCLKDELLIVCYNTDGGPRPRRFVSSKEPRNELLILRRGKLSVGVSDDLRLPD